MQTRRCQCFIKHPEICVKFWSSNYEFVWRVNFQTPFLGSFLQLTWMNEVWNLSPLPLQWTFLLHPFFTPPYLLIQYRFCDHICQYWWTFFMPLLLLCSGGCKRNVYCIHSYKNHPEICMKSRTPNYEF